MWCQESHCRRPGYSPTKLQLTDPAAIQAYEKTLRPHSFTKMQRHVVRYVVGERFFLYTLFEQFNLQLVSRYFLDWVIQPPVAHIPSQLDSFWLHNLRNENESCCYGLGMLFLLLCSHLLHHLTNVRNEDVQRASTSVLSWIWGDLVKEIPWRC